MVDDSRLARFAELKAANTARLHRTANSELIAEIAPLVARHCDRFSIHLGDDVDRFVHDWAHARVPEHGPFVESLQGGHWSEPAAATAPLAALIARHDLDGWAYVMAGFGTAVGREPTIGAEARCVAPLVAALRGTPKTRLAAFYADTWIVQPQGGWAIRVYHEGSVDLARTQRAMNG